VGIVAAAVAKLEAHPFPNRLTHTGRVFIEAIAPAEPFLRRLVLANLWLFSPVVERMLAIRPASRASLHTTQAVTRFDGGIKENVLPASARAVVNFRILPGDTVASVEARAREVIDDPRVQLERLSEMIAEPTAESSADGPAFRAIKKAIRSTFPNAVVAPSLVLGATDARYFYALCPAVYRFIPLRLGPTDVERVHGIDERIPLEGLLEAIRFYRALLGGAEEELKGS
jgi:carboxypeptidase PM20D1